MAALGWQPDMAEALFVKTSRPGILFLSPESSLQGGGEFFLLDAVNSLRKEYDIACVVPCQGKLAGALQQQGIKVVFSPTAWSSCWWKRLIREMAVSFLAWRVYGFRPCVIYANGGTTGNLAVRLGGYLNCPVIVHVHDVFAPVKKDKYSFCRADVVLACSAMVADMVRPFNPDVEILYNAVDTGRYSPAGRSSSRQRLGFSEKDFVVGFAGTIVRKKGIAGFVDVARLVSGRIPDAVFCVAGAPKPEDESLFLELKEKIERDGMRERFQWMGFVSDLPSVLPAFDVLLFPVHFEAFGRVVIEAMACGVVPVSSAGTGPAEIITDGQTGFLRSCKDIESLAEAVCILYAEPHLRLRMGRVAREDVMERFSLEGLHAAIKDVIIRVQGRVAGPEIGAGL